MRAAPDALPADPLVRHRVVSVESSMAVEFVDITSLVIEAVVESGVLDGLAAVQTWHTTTGLLINEHEPLLLDDLRRMFARIAPAEHPYAHDDFTRRTTNLNPGERRNGHAHCRAALLRTTEWMPIAGGALTLGRWQSLFLVDFDGPQRRQVSVLVMGVPRLRT
jgi:secondary thiamine-phosphate synthase enzyme